MTNDNVELRLSAGQEVMVQFEKLPQRLKTSIIGAEKDQYVILRCPGLAGLSQCLRAGLKIKVTYLVEGNVYGFQSSVLSFIQLPGELIFLRYPGRVERVELRQDPRIDCYLPARLKSEQGEAKGFITNISPGGCRFAGKTDDLRLLILSEESKIDIAFQFIGLDGDQLARGIVRSLQSGTVYTGVGVQFKGTDSALANRIRAYVGEVLEYSNQFPR